MSEISICMGCFREKQDNEDVCPICKYESGNSVEEDGFVLGQVLGKRYLLGTVFEKEEDYVIWYAYDKLLDIPVLAMLPGKDELMSECLTKLKCVQSSEKKRITILAVKTFLERTFIFFSTKKKVKTKDDLWKNKADAVNDNSLITEIEYEFEGELLNRVLKKDTLLDNRYRVLGVVGMGGFGNIYLCEDISLGRNVAIKEYFPSQWAERDDNYVAVKKSSFLEPYRYGMQTFLREAKIMAKFIHQKSIISIYDVFEENDTAYIVMEYLSGISIGKEMKNRDYKGYTSKEINAIMIPVLKSLDALHDKKIVHSDLSPGNIIRTDDGRIVLIDFGAAKYYLKNQPVLSAAFLKPDYAAPEQYQTAKSGVAKYEGPWTDIYAVGATMYYLLTGAKAKDALSRLSSKDTGKLKVKRGVSRVPRKYRKIIKQCMELERKERPSNVRTIMEALYEIEKVSAPLLNR